MTAVPLSHLATSRRWQTNFMNVLPAVETHASVCFRHLRGDALAEAIAQAIASACLSYATLVRQGKLSRVYAGSLANYAVKAVNSFRVVGGRQSARCVMNPLAQKLHSVAVKSMSPWSRSDNTWREVVVESRRVSPADRAAFNVDFQEWMKQWPEAQRQEQLQAQLQAEQAKRLEAEKSARAAESSRDAWIIGLGAGACVVGIMAILIGIHIGSRAMGRGRKEKSDG